MAKPPTNIAASVCQRLLNLARREQRLFNVVLASYGLERVIYRLSISTHANKFILKGGMLVTLWTVDHGRFMRDVDFRGFGASDSQSLIATYKEILAIDVHDGLKMCPTTAFLIQSTEFCRCFGRRRRVRGAPA